MGKQPASTTVSSLDQAGLPHLAPCPVEHIGPARDRALENESPTTDIVSPFAVRCFGAFTVSRLGQRIEHWYTGKARELFLLLATHVRMTATHTELIDTLWPEYDAYAGQRSLYSAAWALRKSLDEFPASGQAAAVARSQHARRSPHAALQFRPSVLVSERGRYSLNRSLCTIDLTQLRRRSECIGSGARTDEWLDLATQLAQPLLVGETYPWLVSVRHAVRDRALYSFSRATRRALQDGDDATALTALRARLALDPVHEDSVALVMRIYCRRGQSAHTATCYRAFVSALDQASQLPGAAPAHPSRELQELYRAAVHPLDMPSSREEHARAPPHLSAFPHFLSRLPPLTSHSTHHIGGLA